MGYHFWRIRKAGGVIVPASKKDEPLTDTYPNLVAREFVVALVLLAFLLVISAVFDAPLRERANPYFSPNPAKAPWYFMGLQELLIHFHPVFVVVVFPLTILAGSLWLPFLKLTDTHSGIWFISDKGKKAGKYAVAAGIIFTVVFILVSELLPDPETLLAIGSFNDTDGSGSIYYCRRNDIYVYEVYQKKYSTEQGRIHSDTYYTARGFLCSSVIGWDPVQGTRYETDVAMADINKIKPTGKTGRREFFSQVWSILGLVALGELVFFTLSMLRPGKEIPKRKSLLIDKSCR